MSGRRAWLSAAVLCAGLSAPGAASQREKSAAAVQIGFQNEAQVGSGASMNSGGGMIYPQSGPSGGYPQYPPGYQPQSGQNGQNANGGQWSDQSQQQGQGQGQGQQGQGQGQGQQGQGSVARSEQDHDAPDRQQNRPAPSPAPEAAPAPEAPRGPMSLGDAKFNFPTVVETFLAEHSARGAWTYKQGGRSRRLKLSGVDTSRLRKTGSDRYAAPVNFVDLKTRQRVSLDFTVDFSGSDWRVAGIKSRARRGR